MKELLVGLISLACSQFCFGQQIKILSEESKMSFRGLSVPDDATIWVSGSQGTIGRSLDSGNTWKWMQVKGFEKTEFRDIEAFDKQTAVIMGIGEPAYILRTIDGGENWQVVFKDTTSGMFLDAMEFWNEQSGIVIGDPIDNLFYIARTFDGGRTWQPIPVHYRPAADRGEACFASSGTNIRKLNSAEAVFISGGLQSNLFLRDKKLLLPLKSGKSSTGANSIAVKNKRTMIVVGGDFENRNDTTQVCVITTDGGKNWHSPSINPGGYRSCVEYIEKKKWITCGLNGVDISTDEGITWKNISTTGFHVVMKSKKGKNVFLAGSGKVGKLVD